MTRVTLVSQIPLYNLSSFFSSSQVIFYARKSVLYNDGEPWVRTEGGIVDFIMRAYDGAEVCELIGIYML